jgi:hypothetical protein
MADKKNNNLIPDELITGKIYVIRKRKIMLDEDKEILKKLDDPERKDIEHDKKILLIFEFLKQLEQAKQQDLEQRSRKRVGFKRPDDD